MEELQKQLVSFTSAREMHGEVRSLQQQGKRVGLVPTMGFLHQGHLSLVDLAFRHCDVVIVSIFVNPTQFNEEADLKGYPRDLKRDLEMLESRGVHGVFCPDAGEVYGESFQSSIALSELSKDLEGAYRPGHFNGVTTVVGILFNIIPAEVAVFGEKDFQQLRIIEQMVSDLHFPTRILRAPLVREPDGLAMSSRNVLLTDADRQKALSLNHSLLAAQRSYQAGERRVAELTKSVKDELNNAGGIEVEYVEIVSEDTLQAVSDVGDTQCRVLLAARVGKVRLIDNMALCGA